MFRKTYRNSLLHNGATFALGKRVLKNYNKIKLLHFAIFNLVLSISNSAYAANELSASFALSHDIRISGGLWDIYVNRSRGECFAYTEQKDRDGSSSSFWIGKNPKTNKGFLTVGNHNWSFLEIGKRYGTNIKFINKKNKIYKEWTGLVNTHLFFKLPVLSLESVPANLIDDVANAFFVEFDFTEQEPIKRFSLKGTKKIIAEIEKCNSQLSKGVLDIDYTLFGATQKDIDVGIASQLGLDDTLGVVLENIDPEGPAGRAGLKAFDIVREIDGKKIPNIQFWMRVRSSIDPGECAEIKVFRGGEEKLVPVVFGDFRDPLKFLQSGPLVSCADTSIRKTESGNSKSEIQGSKGQFPDDSAVTNLNSAKGSKSYIFTEAERLFEQAKREVASSASDAAKESFNKALRLLEDGVGADDPQISYLVERWALILRQRGDYSAAEPLFRRSLSINERTWGPGSTRIVGTLMNLANVLAESGKYEKAEELYRRALSICEEKLGEKDEKTIEVLHNFATVLEAQDDLEAAENLYRRVLLSREIVFGPDSISTADTLNNLAEVLRKRASFKEAERLHRKALAIREKMTGAESDVVAQSLGNLAIVYQEVGSLGQAADLYRRALAIREKLKGSDHPDTLRLMGNLGILLGQNGDYEEAEVIHRRVLALREKALGLEHPDTLSAVNILAEALRERGDYDLSEPLYLRAVKSAENVFGKEHTQTANYLGNLGLLYFERGEIDRSQQYLRQALAIQERIFGPQHLHTTGVLNNLASLLQMKGDYDAAEPLVRRVVAINERFLGKGHPTTAISLGNLAILLENQGKYEKAEPYYRQSAAILEGSLGRENPDTARSLVYLAKFLNNRGSYDEALDLAREAALSGVLDRDMYLAALHSRHLSGPSLLSESFRIIQSAINSEAGVALANLSSRFVSGNTEIAGLVREEQDDSARETSLDKLYLAETGKPSGERNPKYEEALRVQIEETKTRLASVRNRLAKDFPDYAELSRPKPLELEVAQKLLKDDEALIIIDTVKNGEGDYVWAVTKNDTAWQKLETAKGEIDELVAALLPALSPDNEAEIDLAKAHRLYSLTLGAFDKQLLGKKHLIFVLNGAMTSIPPHVLVTRDPAGRALRDVDWLINDYAVTVLPTVSSLKLLRGSPAGPTAAKPMRGYADVAYAPKGNGGDLEVASRSVGELFIGGVANTRALQGASPLPATGPEARSVMQVLGGEESDIITGRAASETEIKAAPLSDYRVLYFATHGLLAGEVEELAKVKAEPALLFAVPEKPTPEDDGLLTASEVAQLKLNADWAVLSACNTAAGGKPGAAALSGLARAFFYAGARSLLVSHWPVEDEATKALMVRLFETVKANPGMRAAEAQQSAMLSVMNDPEHPQWANPAYWAPFILVGEPRS